jgi:hypothetical protein
MMQYGSAREGIYKERIRKCFNGEGVNTNMSDVMGSKADVAIRLFLLVDYLITNSLLPWSIKKKKIILPFVPYCIIQKTCVNELFMCFIQLPSRF